MKRVLIILALFLSTSTAHAIESDKLLHFGACSIIGLGVDRTLAAFDKSATVRVVGGITVAMLVGTAKEVYDRRQPGNKFDLRDLAADGIGAVVGVTVGEVWGFIVTPTRNGAVLSRKF